IFAGERAGEPPREREALAFVASGGNTEEGRAQPSREVDFYDLKGSLEAGIDAMKLGPLTFEPAVVKHLREGQTAAIKLNEKTVGSIGRLAESTAGIYKFRQAVYAGELDFTALLASDERSILYQALARYPAVVRDVTLLVKREIGFADLVKAVLDEHLQYCRNVQLVGVYEGSNISEDRRAITLRIEYRSDERTLRDDE